MIIFRLFSNHVQCVFYQLFTIRTTDARPRMNHSDLIGQTGLQKHLKLLAIHSDTFTAVSTL